MSRFVASVAALHREATRVIAALGATASNVSSLVAVVTAHLRPLVTTILKLLAVFCNVSNTIASVAKILILFALTCEVPILVALEALFTTSAKATITLTAISATSGTTLGALSGKMTHSITLVASAGTHFL